MIMMIIMMKIKIKIIMKKINMIEKILIKKKNLSWIN